MTTKGYKQTPEHRAKIAAAKRRQYVDPAEREMQRQRGLARSHGKVGTGAYTSWYAMKRRVKKTQPKDRA
jgi:type II secretory pathway predicted ATPase ExeA